MGVNAKIRVAIIREKKDSKNKLIELGRITSNQQNMSITVELLNNNRQMNMQTSGEKKQLKRKNKTAIHEAAEKKKKLSEGAEGSC